MTSYDVCKRAKMGIATISKYEYSAQITQYSKSTFFRIPHHAWRKRVDRVEEARGASRHVRDR